MVDQTNTAAQNQSSGNYSGINDWRVRLALAAGSNYLYNAAEPGILAPLKDTDGVIFPYTPTIGTSYSAHYDTYEVVHNNYKINQYKNSAVEDINITAEFTCQDASEAKYLLAVIHFFRSMTKMFYGQDQSPKPGTPPPLCYIYGYGGFQFDNLPLGIKQFQYNLPGDVDYIKTTAPSVTRQAPTISDQLTKGNFRLPPGVSPGGLAPSPSFPTTGKNAPNNITTWVPTRIQLIITAIPILSRNQVSNNFSLAGPNGYASGNLLLGSTNGIGGFW